MLGLIYARCEERVEPLDLMKGVLVFLTTAMAGFYVIMLVMDNQWLSMALMIWKDVHWVLIEIEFWAVAGFPAWCGEISHPFCLRLSSASAARVGRFRQ